MQTVKNTLIIALIAVVSTGLVRQPAKVKPDPVAILEQQIALTRSAAEFDRDQEKRIDKILRIIARFNPTIAATEGLAIAREIHRMSQKYANLDVDLICATITHESGRKWQPDVVSRAGAMGLMQIMPKTGKWLAAHEGIRWTTAEDILFNPQHNIRLGSRYLSALIDTFELEGGLAAYNGGGQRVKRWLAHNKADWVLRPETRLYVPFVLKLYDEFMDM